MSSLRRSLNWSDPNSVPYSFQVGHFTQLIWKGTTHVGMAYSVVGNYVYVVANYLPPGNVLGKFCENVPPLIEWIWHQLSVQNSPIHAEYTTAVPQSTPNSGERLKNKNHVGFVSNILISSLCPFFSNWWLDFVRHTKFSIASRRHPETLSIWGFNKFMDWLLRRFF